jgi:xylan 1,4-beta-xylosidase
LAQAESLMHRAALIIKIPMKKLIVLAIAAMPWTLQAQMAVINSPADSAAFYTEVNTYVNPVLPGDHPDPTMIKVGDDFYHCGSSFHFTPYLPIYHSRDMVHWEVISRVVPPAKAGFVADKPSAGIWQGAITRFYDSWWIYFSANGQWFCKAASPYGPWSTPVKVRTNAATGDLGYDNSIFVDDDGKPYMVIKNGQKINRIQALGMDGQLTDTVINLDWINAHLQYSWAEGPVMCKRNGYYFYFPAGDVTGGQYVLRSKQLTSDSTKWTRLGDFFKPVTDPTTGFRRPNHISAPLQLADGTWWTIGQSYEKHDGDDWSGTGRQTALYPVTWDGDRPWGMAPVSGPIVRPLLQTGGILWSSVHSDSFATDSLGLWWHFLTKKAAASWSLTARPGWIRLDPDGSRTHLMQKETDHFYAIVTRVDLDAKDSSARAGIYLCNGDQQVFVRFYSGFDGQKKIVFALDTAVRSVPNDAGSTVWLKLVRENHQLTAFYSKDGKAWARVGSPICSVTLDKAQPNYNSWVGTSLGLFAEGKPADFDLFISRDCFTPIPAVAASNFYGIEKTTTTHGEVVTNRSNYGGWLMLSGIDLGRPGATPSQINIETKSARGGTLQVWLDDLHSGAMIGTIALPTTNSWITCFAKIAGVSGTHDVYIRFPPDAKDAVSIKNIQFVK